MVHHKPIQFHHCQVRAFLHVWNSAGIYVLFFFATYVHKLNNGTPIKQVKFAYSDAYFLPFCKLFTCNKVQRIKVCECWRGKYLRLFLQAEHIRKVTNNMSSLNMIFWCLINIVGWYWETETIFQKWPSPRYHIYFQTVK